MGVLTDDEVRAGVPGWEYDGDAIHTTVELADFKAAVAFVVRIGFEAEAANHHPDVDIRYSKVTVTLSTHSEGGVTDKDVELARVVDGLTR